MVSGEEYFQLIKNIALKKGGVCVSDKYINCRTNLKFKCIKEHEWEATPVNVRRGTWCPTCANRPALDLKLFQKMAIARGGRCLSKKYSNSQEKLKFKCAAGHVWQSAGKHIRGGSWCSLCKNKGEALCKAIFEKHFGVEFLSSRPKWLTNFSGKTLELDGFSEKLMIAFEHQGLQHYEKNKFFRVDDTKLKSITKNDLFKKQKCKEKGVHLFAVPSIYGIIGSQNVIGYLSHKFEESGFGKINFSIEDVCSFSKSLESLQHIAFQNNGKCLSKSYLGHNQKHLFICSFGHKWKVTPNNLKAGCWCPYCSGRSKTIDIINQEFCGSCISPNYISAKEKLVWECYMCKKKWERSYKNMKRSPKCPSCKFNHRQ